MAENLTRYLVSTPADHAGDVTAELVRRGAWLDGMTSEDDVVIIRARVAPDQMGNFGTWLTRNTRGIGQVTEDSDATKP